MGICCTSSSIRAYSVTNMRAIQSRNVDAHHTNMYNYSGLIFRRGVPFSIDVPYKSGGAINEKKICVTLVAEGIDKKNISLVSNSRITDNFSWGCYVPPCNKSDDKIVIALNSPVDAIVGQYSVMVYLNGDLIGSTEFLLIFNPWCPDDDVYMANSDDREEYLLNDSTKIYMGTEEFVIPKEWDLGQFEPGPIQASIILLNMMSTNRRIKAVDVSRQLSALINSNDDYGVIVGNWSGNYRDGVSPTAWSGSTEILTRFANTRCSVKYGQCWVFCGVLCTVLRTIGIPSRCITNYASLHDTDGSLKWEIYLDSDFNPINGRGDSCWNFHCWNEAWMKRDDLGSKYSGWQVLDATPQERSGGLFRLGPASKVAVREAAIDKPYDVGFVYAEVNADKVYFLRQPNGTFKQYMIKKGELGKMILTKQKLSDERCDISNEYKAKATGSVRGSMLDTDRSLNRATSPSVEGRIKININAPCSVSLTDDLKGSVSIRGLCDVRGATVKLEVTLMSYTGRNICKLFNKSEKVTDSCKEIPFTVDRHHLMSSVVEEFPFVRCKVYCFDSSNDELACAEKIVSVKTPDLEIEGLPEVCKIETPVSCRVSVVNTLERSLTDVKLYLAFTDDKHRTIKIGEILPGQKLAKKVILLPKTIGTKKLYVSLESRECCGFSNTAKFTVTM